MVLEPGFQNARSHFILHPALEDMARTAFSPRKFSKIKTLSNFKFLFLVGPTMKTNSSTPTLNPTQETAGISRLAKTGRLLIATLCVSLVSFTAAPKAQAAPPNGSYEFQSASGSLRYDGDDVDIPKWLVKKVAGVVDGEIVIENNQLRVNKRGTVRLIEKFGDDIDVDVEAKASGPNNVVLVKTGTNTFSGKTTSPIVTSFEGDVFGEDFSGELISRVSATVQRKTLTIVIRFSGEAFGEDFSGRITITAKR